MWFHVDLLEPTILIGFTELMPAEWIHVRGGVHVERQRRSVLDENRKVDVNVLCPRLVNEYTYDTQEFRRFSYKVRSIMPEN